MQFSNRQRQYVHYTHIYLFCIVLYVTIFIQNPKKCVCVCVVDWWFWVTFSLPVFTLNKSKMQITVKLFTFNNIGQMRFAKPDKKAG